MRRTPWIIGLIAPALIGVRALAGDGIPSPTEVILLQRCTIEYERSTRVGANPNTTMGLLQDCLVRQGDRVKAGQVLGRLFNKDALANLQALTVALEISETTIRQREAALVVERAKLKRDEKLFSQNRAVSVEALQIQQLAVRAAELDLQAAIQNRRMVESQVNQGKALVAARDIVSPHDGIVAEIYINAGEPIHLSAFNRSYEDYFNLPIRTSNFQSGMYVICKVVDVDRIRVIGFLDVGDAWHVRQGQAVRIMPELEGSDLPIEREVFEGKITFVDSEIDSKARTCRVFAEVENRGGLLRSGLECRMEIDLSNHPRIEADATGPVPTRPECMGAPSVIAGSVPGPSLPGITPASAHSPGNH
jgi:multidrug efflux pump subunit AcrA (membrane-fusion protein)